MPGQEYVALLHGRNIFGRGRVTNDEIRDALAAVPGVECRAIVGASGNVVLTTAATDDERLAAEVEAPLGSPCVVVSLTTLKAILSQALERARSLSADADRSFKITQDGVRWELGLVFSSDELPAAASGRGGIFAPTDHAVAMEVLSRRALLVQKRDISSNGTRIPFGEAVNRPWRSALKRLGVSPRCLTSRSLGRIAMTVRAGEEAVREGRSAGHLPSASRRRFQLPRTMKKKAILSGPRENARHQEPTSFIERLRETATKLGAVQAMEPLIASFEDGNAVAAWIQAHRSVGRLLKTACDAANPRIDAATYIDQREKLLTLGLISQKMAAYLHLLRKVRNSAAHDDHCSFQSGDLRLIAELVIAILSDGHNVVAGQRPLW